MFKAFQKKTGRTAALLTFVLACTAAGAQGSYPTQPVRAVLPYSAGSGPDSVVRHVGELISGSLGQSVVVDNRPGGNGWLAAGEVQRAKPDGHTLLVLDNTYMALQPHLYKKMPFDPVRDFEPVAGLYNLDFFIVVGAKSPWKSAGELIAAAKAQPGKVTYGSWGLGSVAHVGTAQLEAASGIQMLHVPFKELPQLYTAVSTGEVDWAFGSAATVAPLYKAGKVKLLAYAGPKRQPSYKDVPTLAESGGPSGVEVGTWVAVFAPKNTPRAAISRLQAEIGKAQASPALLERLSGFGFQPWTAGTAEVASAMSGDNQRFAQVVKSARISLD
ncbi:MAG: tripartite tricarboxylate transporter substrate binding protein [Ottowia sp.]|uniref:Bug family tripartite tricarboxylate transporter substrate binding protein n=1 Tax=unclassified Ottowia TaxID=2645081 RepID=UPI003C2CBEED